MSDIAKFLEERRNARKQAKANAQAREFLAENQVIEDAYFTPEREEYKPYNVSSSDNKPQGIKNIVQRADDFTAVPGVTKHKRTESIGSSGITKDVDTSSFDNSITGRRMAAQKELGSVYSGIRNENKTPMGVTIPETIDELLSKSFSSGVKTPQETAQDILSDSISPETKANYENISPATRSVLENVRLTTDAEFSATMDKVLGENNDATIDDIMSKMELKPDGTYSVDGQIIAHNEKYARMLAENYYNEREHWKRFLNDRDYRADYIYKTTGMNEEQYIAKKADNYSKKLDEIEQALNALNADAYKDDMYYYDDGGGSAFAARYIAANKPIRDIRAQIRSFKKNGFWSGLAEGFSLSDLLLFGLPGITDSMDTLTVLNKAGKGEKLDKREEVVYKLAQLAQEVEEDRSIFRNNDTFSANNVGNIVGMMPEFGAQMMATSGLAPFGKMLAQASIKQAFKSSVKKGLALGLKKAGASMANRAIQTPFMAMTYQNYIDNRRAQYSFENHMLRFSPSNAFSDAWKAYAGQFSEIHSEDVGDWISEGMAFAGRAIAHTKFIDRLTGGTASRIADKLSRYKLPPVLAKMRKDMRISGFAGENLSEAYGDLINSVLTMDPEGAKQLATSKYWWELMASTAIMTGSFYSTSIPDLYSYNKTYNRLRKATDSNLDKIQDADLRNNLKVAMANANLDTASRALSKIDWSQASTDDIVNAIRYADGSIRLGMLRSENIEDLRLAEFMPYVKYMEDNAYRGIDGAPVNGDEKLVSATTKDGDVVWIISGDYAGNGTLVVRDSEGKPKMINGQDVLSTQEMSISDLLSIQYAQSFNTSIAREQLENVVEAVRNATADDMPTQKVVELIRNNGFRIYKVGDNVKLSNGEDATIDTNVNGYEYLVRTSDNKLRLVQFYSILQPDATMAQAQVDLENEQQVQAAQQEVPDGAEQATEAAQQVQEYKVGDDVQTADGRAWTISRQIEPQKYVLTDENGEYLTATNAEITPYNGNVSISASEEIPTDKNGNVDYAQIKDPQIIARQLATDMGSAESALSALATVMANIESRISQMQTDNTTTAVAEMVARKKEMDALAEELATYRQAYDILQTQTSLNNVPDIVNDTPTDARERGYRRVNGNKVNRQTPIKAVQGKEVDVKFSDDTTIKGNVAIIDAEQLQPSHIDGQRNPVHFIDEAQPKERNDKASQTSARKIAENIRPEEVTTSITAYTGAPTVNTRGEVIQGNNRSYALRLMWRDHKEQAEKYKAYLKEHAQEFGLTAEDIDRMKNPVLVNMLNVDDAQAIALGQYEASDTESGGVERIKPKNVLQKMGQNVGTFANLLLRSSDEEISFAGLIDLNGVAVLKWLSNKGYITPTQYNSAFDSRGSLTAEAKNDLRNIMYQNIFKGAGTQLETMFNALPIKAQRAILATAFRDYDSPESERMLAELQNSIRAYNAISHDAAFMAATSVEDVHRAVEAWKRQYQMDDVTGESYLPAENFTNFALLLAEMYKGQTQSYIQGKFNQLYDLIQGVKKGELFEDQEAVPHTLAEAIKQALNIDYNGQLGSNVLGSDATPNQRGQQGSDGATSSGEQTANGTRPTDSTGGTASDSGESQVEERGDELNLERTKRQAHKNGGELIMLSPKDKVESLSTPLVGLSSDNKGSNNSAGKQEKAEKVEEQPQPSARANIVPSKPASLSNKIEDYGEVIKGARKDAMKELSKSVDNATLESLISLPFAKAFKRPDLRKAVDEGALREQDARFVEAVMATYLSTKKPKADTKKDKYRKAVWGKSKVEVWADEAYKGVQLLKQLFEAEPAERDRIMAEAIAEHYMGVEAAKAHQERLKEWNPGKTFTGESYPINNVALFNEVLSRLGNDVGTTDIPVVSVRPSTSYDSYLLVRPNGETLYPTHTLRTFEDVVDEVVYLTKLNNADADTEHPGSAFKVQGLEPHKEVVGYYVRYLPTPSSTTPKEQEFKTKEEADAFYASISSKKGVMALEPHEMYRISGYGKYEIVFKNPITDEWIETGMTYASEGDASFAIDQERDALNKAVNDKLAEANAKAGKSKATEYIQVRSYFESGKLKYGVAIADKYGPKRTAFNTMPYYFAEGFSTRKEAEVALEKNRTEWEDFVKDIIRKRQEYVYFDGKNAPRVGKDYRVGKDVTEKDFAETFGFRGVQFGNWTNQNDRQAAVNNAYDSFMDLANIIGVSPRALSLNGELGIAFGSRGSGKANAHYESDNVVINLTKTRGAGSLAHEWWHALDNYFARQAKVPAGFVTSDKKLDMREQMRQAFDDLIDDVAKSDYHNRSKARGAYWGDPIEEIAEVTSVATAVHWLQSTHSAVWSSRKAEDIKAEAASKYNTLFPNL